MSTPPLEQTLGLRERKKLRTRRAIQDHALRLFGTQGYDATTIEQIAEAAEVSQSTFFRYFPTKQDLVLSDEYDPLIVTSLRSQPPEMSPADAARRTLHEIVGGMLAADRHRVFERSRIMLSVPALRARQWDKMAETRDLFAGALAERLGRSPADLEIRWFVAALMSVWETSVGAWVESGGEGGLLDHLDRGIAFLTTGCRL
jgi:AcrR family transcriptional regulator